MRVFSICDYSGNWSKPYADAGYEVYRFDPKLETKTRNNVFCYGWTVEELINHLGVDVPERCDVFLMAPPCTHFSVSCNRFWAEKDADGRTAAALRIIDQCVELLHLVEPVIWALENPVGRLWKLRPELGKPWYFQPCDFGEDYKKKTGLVGIFTPPLPLFIGEDLSVKPTKQFDRMHKWSGEKRRESRSVTPLKFAEAFFKTNNPMRAK